MKNPDYFVHESAYIDAEVQIGEGTKIWHFSHIQQGAMIGEYCNLGQNVNIAPGVRIGNHCKIQNNVSLYSGVTLEDYVFCGPSCVFTNDLRPRCLYPKTMEEYFSTLLERGASIGANATIVCGHKVGRHAMVGAGSVVTKNVPAHALVVGCPASQIAWVCECGNILKEDLSCPHCLRKYEKAEDGLKEKEDK